MDEPEIPADPFLEGRLATLAVLPVPERPTLDDLAWRGTGDVEGTTAKADRTLHVGRNSDRQRRSHRLWLLTGAAAAVVLVLVAGAVVRSRTVGPASALVEALGDRTFVSVSITEAGVPRDLVPAFGSPGPAQLSVEFIAAGEHRGDSVSMHASCNWHGSTYEIVDGRMVVGEQSSITVMGCPQEYDADERWIDELLESSPTLVLDGDRLTMTSGDTVVELVDAGSASAPPTTLTYGEMFDALAGPRWELEAVVVGSVRTTVDPIDGTERPYLELSSNVDGSGGSVVGRDGCNGFRASVVPKASLLTFGPVGSTNMACQGDAPGAVVEESIALVLSGEASYAIDGDVLTLTAGDRTLELRSAGEPVDDGTFLDQGWWTSYTVAADDRTVTFTLGCAYTGAERFSHAEQGEGAYGSITMKAMVRVPEDPRFDTCATSEPGTFTVVLGEPLAGREIIQPLKPGPVPPTPRTTGP